MLKDVVLLLTFSQRSRETHFYERYFNLPMETDLWALNTEHRCDACLCILLFLIQIFEEEHSILYLDQGGVLVAMKHTSLPIRHLW